MYDIKNKPDITSRLHTMGANRGSLAVIRAGVPNFGSNQFRRFIRALRAAPSKDIAKSHRERVAGQLDFVLWSASEEYAVECIFRCLKRASASGYYAFG